MNFNSFAIFIRDCSIHNFYVLLFLMTIIKKMKTICYIINVKFIYITNKVSDLLFFLMKTNYFRFFSGQKEKHIYYT